MPSPNADVPDPHAPQTFRRVTTVTWAIVMSLFLVIVAGFISSGLTSHGFLAAIAPLCGAFPLVVFVVLSFLLPRVVVAEDAFTVENALTAQRIPYPAVKDFIDSRMGLVVTLAEGGKVPVTAYMSGSNGKLFGHPKALRKLVDAIEAKMDAHEGEPVTPVIRTVRTPNLVLSIISVVVAAIVIVVAILS